MMLSCLPGELLLAIAAFVTEENDINSLVRVSKRLYTLINPYLYRSNFQFSRSSALIWVIRSGIAATVRTSIQNGGDVNTYGFMGRTPLFHAVYGGNEMIFNMLLDTSKVDVDWRDEYGQTPLSYASLKGRKAVVKMLLATGKVDADWRDRDGQTPLLVACAGGHGGVVKTLLATGKVDANL